MNYTVISVKDMRNNLSNIIDRVAVGGETFVVTKFGKTRAIISPADKETMTAERREEILKKTFGMWKDREDIKDAAAWVREQRKQMSSRYEKIFD